MKRLPRFCTLLPLDGYLASTHVETWRMRNAAFLANCSTQIEAQQID